MNVAALRTKARLVFVVLLSENCLVASRVLRYHLESYCSVCYEYSTAVSRSAQRSKRGRPKASQKRSLETSQDISEVRRN